MVVARAARAEAQQPGVTVHRPGHRGREDQELRVGVRVVARLEQVLAVVGRHRPVVVLARPVDAREGLLVQQTHEAVPLGYLPQHLHDQHLVVGRQVGGLERRGQFVLPRRHLVVAGLDGHAQAEQLVLHVGHVGQHALVDRAEILVVQLLSLGRLGAEQRPPGRDQIRAVQVETPVDQEVLLLRPDGREHAFAGLVAEQPQHANRLRAEGFHRPQQRRFLVQRIARPTEEHRRDHQRRAVGVVQDEGRARRIPRGVPAGLERRAKPAGREAAGVRLAAHQVLAAELGHNLAVAAGRDEAVVLLGRAARHGLEPVREVRRTVLDRPVPHRQGHRVGDARIQLTTGLDRVLQRLEDGLRQTLRLHGLAEHVLAVHLANVLGDEIHPPANWRSLADCIDRPLPYVPFRHDRYS